MTKNVTVFQCPNCLANLEIEKGETAVCPYCGSSVQFADEDGSVHVHTHIHDEAELRRIEIEEERRRRERAEREEQERRKREELDRQRESAQSLKDERGAYKDLWIKCLVGWIGVVVLGSLVSTRILPQITGAIGLSVIAGPIALFLLRPGAYAPGESARNWRRAVVIYFAVLAVLFCFTDASSAISMMAFLWLVGGPVFLYLKRPNRTKKPRKARK